MRLAYLGAECLTAGSSEPSSSTLALVNTPMGQAVRHAVQTRFVLHVPQASVSIDDQILDEYLRGPMTGTTNLLKQWLAEGKITRAQAMQTNEFKSYAVARSHRPSFQDENALLDRIVAVYMQWTWVPKWNSRSDVTPEEIMKDPCFPMAVLQVAPLSEDKGIYTPVGPMPMDWSKLLLIGGAVVLGGVLLYAFLKKRKKKGATAPLGLALPAATASVPLALPSPVKG